ncbi:hypothetical protein BC939DRAFT_457511 [Gamsiella multidivaricata]|uniref:uncharacterized protein n=1 Tax=Gamsiella multidivaricata TaxID=101098 RepID=UPI00221FC722|nr:uncharacterized protein BC939DRAFT_457511 [Gamsiella multidivaricata]KAG0361958.1 hypothetical protein BGZ54_008837 [Gamsiella multidivaricata]KAI7820503.1 hypothetical protein BC939DRAFT_457511 [Gamsiella multidivaricata]
MPFQVGVDDADGFVKYLVNVVVVTATVAWLAMLFVRSIDAKVIKYRKPFSVAMTLQLFFVTCRNLTTMMLSSGFPIPCRWVAVIGGVIYQLFAISAECAMLIRCRSFTRYPKMVTYLTIPTWIVRFGLCIWLVTTIKGEDNEAGYICDTSMDYNLSAIMQYIKIATEVIILVFFLERVIALHRSSRGMETDASHSHWKRLALINAGITFLVILFEVLVGQVTVYLTGYLFLTYSLVNFIQATLVVFIVEDTKNVFKKRAATSNSASKQSNSNNHSGSNAQRSNDYDSSTVSYADGVAAAKVNRLHDPSQLSQQPWSLTMRAPSVMPESVPVHYSPQSNDRPSSHFYDFGQMDQKSSLNRHWDVDPESQDTIDGSKRWKYNRPEDEIPMTLAKSREDAQNPRR